MPVSSLWLRWAWCSSHAFIAVDLPSKVTTPKGKPKGASALRRCARNVSRCSTARRASMLMPQTQLRSVVSAMRRGILSILRMASDISLVSFSIPAKLFRSESNPTNIAAISWPMPQRRPRIWRASATSPSRSSPRRAFKNPDIRRICRKLATDNPFGKCAGAFAWNQSVQETPTRWQNAGLPVQHTTSPG